MLRPSRPMILPFIASLGRSTSWVVVCTAYGPGEPLRRGGENAAGPVLCLEPGLLLDLAQRQPRLALGIGLDLVEQRLTRLSRAQRGDPLQLSPPAGLALPQQVGAAVETALAGVERFPATLQLVELSVQRLQPIQHPVGLRTVAA